MVDRDAQMLAGVSSALGRTGVGYERAGWPVIIHRMGLPCANAKTLRTMRNYKKSAQFCKTLVSFGRFSRFLQKSLRSEASAPLNRN